MCKSISYGSISPLAYTHCPTSWCMHAGFVKTNMFRRLRTRTRIKSSAALNRAQLKGGNTVKSQPETKVCSSLPSLLQIVKYWGKGLSINVVQNRRAAYYLFFQSWTKKQQCWWECFRGWIIKTKVVPRRRTRVRGRVGRPRTEAQQENIDIEKPVVSANLHNPRPWF